MVGLILILLKSLSLYTRGELTGTARREIDLRYTRGELTGTARREIDLRYTRGELTGTIRREIDSLYRQEGLIGLRDRQIGEQPTVCDSDSIAKRPALQFELPKTPSKKVAIKHDTRSLSPTEITTKTPPTKVATEHDTSLLSPSKITTAGEHATVTGLLASLSPIKPSRYLDGELTDGESVIRLVGFDKAKLRQLQPFSEYGIPVTLRNCLIQKQRPAGGGA